jgi:hypothetical protein
MPRTSRPLRRIDQPQTEPRYASSPVPAAPYDFADAPRSDNPGLPLAPAGLTIETVDGTVFVPNVTRIIVTNGTLTNDGDGVVTIDTGAGGGGSLYFSFNANGSQAVEVDEAATYGSSSNGGTGGGTFSITKNGASASVPFSVAAGDDLVVTLAGATLPVVRSFTLTRTA